MPMLVTAVTTGGQYYYGPTDERYVNGRAVLFQDASVFVGNGQFWRMDNAGATTGPY
jgi:hypothetical protein